MSDSSTDCMRLNLFTPQIRFCKIQDSNKEEIVMTDWSMMVYIDFWSNEVTVCVKIVKKLISFHIKMNISAERKWNVSEAVLKMRHFCRCTFSHPVAIQFRLQFKSACLTITIEEGYWKKVKSVIFILLKKKITIDIVWLRREKKKKKNL